jgi:lipoprotein-anchoring transpeptidase ErfK/SrfK
VALLAGVALLLTACSTSGTKAGVAVTVTASNTSRSAAPSDSVSRTTAPATPVHVSLNINDGATYGVGMPIIATFPVKITDGAAFQKATRVTVNGTPAQGAWYFEYSDPASGHAMEAHYRLQNYWPANSQIHMDLPVKGKSAGEGLEFDDSLTSDWVTGPANIATVDDSTHLMTVTTDGQPWGTFHVSLGAAATPTQSGVKVIMEKGDSICMSGQPPNGPAYHECGVKWTQRLTYAGEYLHAAPWNLTNIARGVDSSNGCTNLTTDDALKLYNFLRIGDVVLYPNAPGPKMQLGDGYGDWNVSWSQWQTGGAVSTG